MPEGCPQPNPPPSSSQRNGRGTICTRGGPHKTAGGWSQWTLGLRGMPGLAPPPPPLHHHHHHHNGPGNALHLWTHSMVMAVRGLCGAPASPSASVPLCHRPPTPLVPPPHSTAPNASRRPTCGPCVCPLDDGVGGGPDFQLVCIPLASDAQNFLGGYTGKMLGIRWKQQRRQQHTMQRQQPRPRPLHQVMAAQSTHELARLPAEALNCFNCGRSGHWSQDCPNLSKRQGGGRVKGEPPTFPSLSATSDPEVCAPGSQSLKEGFSTELHTFPESRGDSSPRAASCNSSVLAAEDPRQLGKCVFGQGRWCSLCG